MNQTIWYFISPCDVTTLNRTVLRNVVSILYYVRLSIVACYANTTYLYAKLICVKMYWVTLYNTILHCTVDAFHVIYMLCYSMQLKNYSVMSFRGLVTTGTGYTLKSHAIRIQFSGQYFIILNHITLCFTSLRYIAVYCTKVYYITLYFVIIRYFMFCILIRKSK